MTTSNINPIRVFYSYAHEDEKYRKRLDKQLSSLKKQGLITDWHNHMISAGKEWEQETNKYLSTAKIILLLVSPDFISSDYCYGVEVRRAMEKHDAGEARVIPIIVRPTAWEDAPFSKLQVLPTDGKPATSWRKLDEAFLDIAKGILNAIKELHQNEIKKSRFISLNSQYIMYG